MHFGKTSSLAYELSHDNEVWKSLYLRTFGSTKELQFTDDGRSIYVLRYKMDQPNTDLKNKFNHLQDELGQSESTNIKLIETITELKDIVNTLTLKNSLFEKDFESLKHELSHKDLNNEQLSDKLRNLQLVLTFLTSSESTSIISPLEETTFRNTLHKKQAQSTEDIYEAKNEKGRPVLLREIRRVEVSSDKESNRHSEKGAKTLSSRLTKSVPTQSRKNLKSRKLVQHK